jgi:AraC family transcriptional regulator, arabinose operon regulatory protein
MKTRASSPAGILSACKEGYMSDLRERLRLIRGGNQPPRPPAEGGEDSRPRIGLSLVRDPDAWADGETQPSVALPPPAATADHRVKRAVKFMRADPSQSADELAARLKLSPSRLRHLFKAGVGVSLGQYLRRLRLLRARWLLETSGLTVTKAMAEVGWADESHFRRDFKARFSLSPGGCRAVARVSQHA